MKFFIILLLTVFCLNSFAENFTSISKLGTNQGFQMKAECERVTGEECFDLGALPSSVYSVTQIDVDDYTKPLFAEKTNVTACEGVACYPLQIGLCAEGLDAYVNNELTQVYCTKLIGYGQKKKDVIALDAAKKSAYDAELVAKAAKAVEDAKIEKKLSRIDAGKYLIAFISVRNESKVLTTEQVSGIIALYSDVVAALQTGSLTTAKALIMSKSPDGILMTSEDKSAMIAEIEKLDK